MGSTIITLNFVTSVPSRRPTTGPVCLNSPLPISNSKRAVATGLWERQTFARLFHQERVAAGRPAPPSSSPLPADTSPHGPKSHISQRHLFQATCEFSLSQHGSSVTYVAADHLTRLERTFTGRVFLLPLLRGSRRFGGEVAWPSGPELRVCHRGVCRVTAGRAARNFP